MAGGVGEGKSGREGCGRDQAAGRTLAGPHRSDLAVSHLGKRQPADRCSTGEQKALLLGLVLAHADLVAEMVGLRAEYARLVRVNRNLGVFHKGWVAHRIGNVDRRKCGKAPT